MLELTSELLDVLVHAHDRGIVHRDIKPENIFLTRQRRARLLDFGMARVEARRHTHAARAGTTLGTPAFMPPEQALGVWSELDGRSDLWSLAATVFLLLSGTPVREQGSAEAQLVAAMTHPVPSLGTVTALPRSVVAVFDRALAFERDERFPDARSMQLAVHALLEELEPPASLPPSSLEAVALAPRSPQGPARPRQKSAPSLRPVTASATPLPLPPAPRSSAGLPLFVALGFTLGIGLVVLERISVTVPAGTAAAVAPPAGAPLPAPSQSRPRREGAPPAGASAAAAAPAPSHEPRRRPLEAGAVPKAPQVSVKLR